MTQEDRIFELERTLEAVLDLFDDEVNGKVYVAVEVEDPDGLVESVCQLPATDADTVLAAIKTLYSEDSADE